MGSTVTPLSVGTTGALSIAGASVSTLPDDWAEATTAALSSCSECRHPSL